MPASILTRTPSGAGVGVSMSSNLRSLCACRRQALWVLAIRVLHYSRRPGQASDSERDPGPITTMLVDGRSWSAIQRNNKRLWLWVPAFAGTTIGEVRVIRLALDLFG